MNLIVIDCDRVDGLNGFVGIKIAYNPANISSIRIINLAMRVIIEFSDQDDYETYLFDTLENAEKFYNKMLEAMNNA